MRGLVGLRPAERPVWPTLGGSLAAAAPRSGHRGGLDRGVYAITGGENEPHTKTFSVNVLLRRGWTKALIARVLGGEDFTTPNVQFPGAADVRLYGRDRVEEAERGAEFRDRQSRKRPTT
jgi:hypothetical protein